MIVMIDMGLGNLDSVRQAFARVGAEVLVTDQPVPIREADALILPGVGAFGNGVAVLRQRGLIEPIRQHAMADRKPLLGICLGMQLFATEGEEHGLHDGLGMIPGRVVRFQPTSSEYRVPNMGWCDVTFDSTNPPFESFDRPETFYFAHSYHLRCDDPADVAATFEYDGQEVTAAIQRGSLLGVQFHPEKSQDAGLQIVESFVEHVVGQPFQTVLSESV